MSHLHRAGEQTEKRPVALNALIVTDIIFAPIGFLSGLLLVIAPSGEALGLSQDTLKGAPVGDFLLVGLYLIAFFGILPGLASYGLLTKSRWRWTDPINKWTGKLWGWTAATAVGVLLLVWIAMEVLFLDFLSGIGGALQVIMTLLGVWILVLALTPSVRRNMRTAD